MDAYFASKGVTVTEGYSQQVPGQVADLIELTTGYYFAKKDGFTGHEIPKKKILEIGFNGGHSADIFLRNAPEAHVYSFDIGVHHYVKIGKEYIDQTYPGRHTLILGDSKVTIPQFQEGPVDLIFIDGDHSYEGAERDLQNCLRLAHENTLIIMDDTMYTQSWLQHWNVGPTKAWTEAKGLTIKEIETHDYGNGRGMSWGVKNS